MQLLDVEFLSLVGAATGRISFQNFRSSLAAGDFPRDPGRFSLEGARGSLAWLVLHAERAKKAINQPQPHYRPEQ